jgi:hydrogenase maturation protease
VIGLGNPFRSDDGVGRCVARWLRELGLRGVEVIEQSGEGAALMEAWSGAQIVFLIDAVQSGAQPGAVHRIDAIAERVPSRFFHYSTHAFSVAEAVELARALNQLPPRLVIFGIEGASFESGENLSPEVRAAAERVVAVLVAEVKAAGVETENTESPKPCTNSP